MPISFSLPVNRDARLRGAGVTAVLGPTNTGKTHLAIERMLAHSSGMIGLPLRLLAREVYGKVVDRVGAEAVALITGEEKIKPPNPRFWVSTVEAMPRDIEVAFLAVDEIQLGADFERGHVFTDRMLHRRGHSETLVLGAATMRQMVDRLLPGANVISRPRLSTLAFAGEKKITRLPRRSAIVAFSTEEVYAIAELIRRQRGGAAVVLGALSPRTRNAQVALYQSGDVDYLVATDAIGMGLNLDVDHVAFASNRKFDGYQFRQLNPAELAQIAGRAGRATRDGTFGTTGRCPPFDQELVQALESHSFEAIKVLQWRNTQLDFSSIGALQASLAAPPEESGLTRAPLAEDILVLDHATRNDDVRALARTAVAIERLWEVCQVPDYRKIAPATHAELIVTLYGFLVQQGSIPTDWFARQVAQADHADGDIDTLSNRIAHVRTWTFVANRPDWLAEPEYWQSVTRAVEDKLSDALHERLAERFVDRRTSVLMRRLRENTMLEAEIGKTGEVVVEGHVIGRLDGFMFAADSAGAGSEAKALHAAAQKALAGEIDARATRLGQAADEQFVLALDGVLRWLGAAVGKVTPGEELLRPRVRILADEHLTGTSRDVVQARLDLWLKTHIEKVLGPLFALSSAESITGIARGVAFQLGEALGVLERQKIAEEVKGLDQVSRAALRNFGVRFGAYHVYIPALLKPAPRALAAQLWALKHGPDAKGLDTLQHLAASGRTSIPVDKDIPKPLYRMAGYRVCGERAVRVDILERLADLIRPALAWRENAPGEKPPGAIQGFGFTVTGAMTSLAGSSGEDFASILRSLGYRMERQPKPPEAAEPSGPNVDLASNQAPTGGVAPELNESEPSTEIPAMASQPVGLDIPPAEPAPSFEAELPVESLPGASEATEPADGLEPLVMAETDSGVVTEPPSEVAVEGLAEPVEKPAVEQLFIEVWRPGGRPNGTRSQRGPRRRHAPQGQRSAAPEPTAASAPPTPETARPAEPEASGQRPERTRRPARPHKRQPDERPPVNARPAKERREKAPDPNSPFAKLATLKAQLESKERR
ncbi:MAG: helicase-related protein [Xanthobacteraceae bacterium]